MIFPSMEIGKCLENPTVIRFEKCNSKDFGDIYFICLLRASNEIVGHVRVSDEIVGHVRASNEMITDMSEPATRLSRTCPLHLKK